MLLWNIVVPGRGDSCHAFVLVRHSLVSHWVEIGHHVQRTLCVVTAVAIKIYFGLIIASVPSTGVLA
jgi:hypothetical protein